MVIDNMWSFVQSLEFVRELEIKLKPIGFHVALTGSILFDGSSKQDLDIIIYPNNSNYTNLERVYEILNEISLIIIKDKYEMINNWRQKHSDDCKHVESYQTQNNKKVDIFFLK